MAKHPAHHPTLEDTYTGPGPLGYWGEWVGYCPACAEKLFGPLPDRYTKVADREAALLASGGKDTRGSIIPFWPGDVALEGDILLCDECAIWIWDHVSDWAKR